MNALGEILTPDLVDEVIVRVRGLLEESGSGDLRRRQLLGQLEAAESQIGCLTDAIASTNRPIAELVTQLQKADAARQALALQIEELADAPEPLRIDWRAIERRARGLLADWRGMLSRQVGEGRQLLRQLLVAPIQFTAFNDSGGRGYRFAGEASLTGLFSGAIDVGALQRNWRPQRDSNPRSLP